MAPLKNARHERFAQLVMEGYSANEAYVKAGYVFSGSNSGRLRENESVAARIDELKLQALKLSSVKAVRVLEELANIAFADPGDAVTWGPDGVTLKDSAALTPAVRATVQSVSETITQHGGSKRITFHPKLPALEALGKYLKLYLEAEADTDDRAQLLATMVQAMVGATHGGFLPDPGALDSTANAGAGTDSMGAE